MRDDGVVGREMTEVAASADQLPRRAEQLLAVLRRVVPFEGARLALVALHHPVYTTLASVDLTGSLVAFLESPAHIRDVEVVGSHLASTPITRRTCPTRSRNCPPGPTSWPPRATATRWSCPCSRAIGARWATS